MLTGLRITSGMGTGRGGISSSLIYKILSHEIDSAFDTLAQTLSDAQKQRGSLTKRRVLDILTTAQWGACAVLGEDHSFWGNR
jgi:hypothetical protein